MKGKLKFRWCYDEEGRVIRSTYCVFRGEEYMGCVARDVRVWVNNRAVRVFKTRQAAAKALL